MLLQDNLLGLVRVKGLLVTEKVFVELILKKKFSASFLTVINGIRVIKRTILNKIFSLNFLFILKIFHKCLFPFLRKQLQ